MSHFLVLSKGEMSLKNMVKLVFCSWVMPLLLLTKNIGVFNSLNLNIIKLLEWELKTNRRIGKKAKSCFNQGGGQKSTKMAPIFLVQTVFTKIRTTNCL